MNWKVNFRIIFGKSIFKKNYSKVKTIVFVYCQGPARTCYYVSNPIMMMHM